MKKYMADIAMILLVFSLMAGCSDKNLQNSSENAMLTEQGTANSENTPADNSSANNAGNSIIMSEEDRQNVMSVTEDKQSEKNQEDNNQAENDQTDHNQAANNQAENNQPENNQDEKNRTENNQQDGNSAEVDSVVINRISDYEPISFELKKKDLAADYNAAECTKITFSDSEVKIEGNNAACSVTDEADGSKLVSISSAGDYLISGSCANGRILIDADKKDDVRLILDGVDLTSASEAAVFAKQCDKLIVTLADNSTNNITDKSAKTDKTDEAEEAEDTEYIGSSDENEDSPKSFNAAVYSKATISINGTGKLNISSENHKGFYSADSVKLVSGNINIKSGGAGIKAKDAVIIDSAELNIESQADAIKITSEKESKGYFLMNGGSLGIKSEKDAVSAKGDINILSGSIDISCSGGTAKSSQSFFGKNPGQKSADSSESSAVSSKGLKAAGVIYIKSGDINIESNDDAIHATKAVLIADGNISLSSGDDAIHADSSVIINNGRININKSYEGIEAEIITINDGKIVLYSNDDGINASTPGSSENFPMNFGGDKENAKDFAGRGPGGNKDFADRQLPDMSTNDGFGRREGFEEGAAFDGGQGFGGAAGAGFGKGGAFGGGFGSAVLTINGGDIYVNANGDGLDSNGSLYINGGIILVEGPTENMNSAVDHDGAAIITGGVVMAGGSAGMIENFEESSTQNVLTIYFNPGIQAGSEIYLEHNNEQLLGLKNTKKFDCIIISSPKIVNGETYTVTVNGEKQCELTVDSTISSNGAPSGEFGFGGRFGGGFKEGFDRNFGEKPEKNN